MNDLTPEEQKKLWMFMGKMEDVPDDIKAMKEELKTLRTEFSNLKGKLVVVAGVVTFALNAIWSVVKGVVT